MLAGTPCLSVTIVKLGRCGTPNDSYDVIWGEPANYELAMIVGDLLVIHREVAVFTANAIRLSALENLGLCIAFSVSV